ncbi:MAG: FGGY-family carbohydrate kinase [Spirochaetaceae bacterium]
MNYYLGVDLGGTVVKASLFDAIGRELGSAGRSTGLIAEEPGQAERDIEAVRKLTYEAIREALEAASIPGSRVTALATTGHGKGLYTIKRDGTPGVGIVSTDTRSRDVAASIAGADDFDEFVYARTLQPFWAAHTAPILVWLKEHRPDRYEEIGHILLAKDLLRFFLTDRVAVEKTDLSGTGLWNNVNPGIDQEILDRLGIPEIGEAIPEIFDSHDIAGSVTDEAAAETGLAAGTPVVAGLFDVNACALATGLEREDELTAVVGTWSISEFVSDDVSRAIEAGERYVIQAHSVPGQWMVHEASPTSASNLEWFTATLLPDIPKEERFEYCNKVVAETPKTGVTFFPFLFGDDLGADASGTFWGLRAGTDRAQIIRAVYEGIVFQHARHMNKLLQVTKPPKQIRFAGGATRSEVWMRMFADVFGLPVTVSTATELGALGAAICAAIGVGEYRSYGEAMKAMTSVRASYEPDEERGAALRKKQVDFDQAVREMAPIWSRHA